MRNMQRETENILHLLWWSLMLVWNNYDNTQWRLMCKDVLKSKANCADLDLLLAGLVPYRGHPNCSQSQDAKYQSFVTGIGMSCRCAMHMVNSWLETIAVWLGLGTKSNWFGPEKDWLLVSHRTQTVALLRLRWLSTGVNEWQLILVSNITWYWDKKGVSQINSMRHRVVWQNVDIWKPGNEDGQHYCIDLWGLHFCYIHHCDQSSGQIISLRSSHCVWDIYVIHQRDRGLDFRYR